MRQVVDLLVPMDIVEMTVVWLQVVVMESRIKMKLELIRVEYVRYILTNGKFLVLATVVKVVDDELKHKWLHAREMTMLQ